MRKITLLFLAATAVAGVAFADRPVDETRPAAANATISIEVISGGVTVTGWARPELSIRGSLGDDVEELRIDGDRDGWTVKVKVPRQAGRRHRDIHANLEVRVPAGANLDVEAVSASVGASGLTGRVELSAVSGDVTLDGGLEEAKLTSISGDVRLKGSAGRVTAEAVSGDIVLEGVGRRVAASTVSGSIELTAGSVERAELESVSGSIDYRGGLAASGSLEVDAHSGNVRLQMPAATSARWSVSTFSGRIDNGFGPPAQRDSRHAPGSSVEFDTGAAGGRIEVQTFSGNVTLKQS